MTRQTRILLIVAGIALAGVGGLAFVAHQYKDRLGAGVSDEDAARAARLVDGFIAARAAAKGVVERYPRKIKQLNAVVTGDFSQVQGQRMGTNVDVAGAYRIERYNAMTAHGMTFEEYATVRTAWRGWKDGKPVEDAALRAALEGKRAALEAASLGEFEPFDDAIK